MMTKKDYVAFARMIREMDDEALFIGREYCLEQLIRRVQLLFYTDNPEFDRDKFQRACKASEIGSLGTSRASNGEK